MIDCKNSDFEELSGKEWIVTNGIGGYSSASITGANTRRYHGILVASFNPPTQRMVVVSKVEESIYYGEHDILLATNEYESKVFPEGYKCLDSFSRSPLPRYHFTCGEVSLAKTIFMVYGSNTTVVEYENTSAKTYLLKLNPQYVHRDYHALWHEQPNFDFQVKQKADEKEIYAFYGANPVYFGYRGCRFVEKRFWNRRLVYRIDQERGQGFMEDICSIGIVEKQLAPGEKVSLVFSLDEYMLSKDPAELKKAETERLSELAPATITDNFLRDLLVSGDQFIVHRRTTDNYSVIAGYHWFTDWGRDSMIAIRGLCIATGRKEIARSVISTFLAYLRQGIIPNRFPDYQGDMAEYNTVDATLWLFVTLYEYDEKFGDTEFLTEVLPRLAEILHQHINGTFHNIKVTDKGLLSQGSPDIQLTWMDARINDTVFTARIGCPVEVNALWYNALKIYEHVCGRLKFAPDKKIVQLREKVEANFTTYFWNRDGHLNDVVVLPRGIDSSIRPNQIFAVSLPFSPLQEETKRHVVECVRKNLLTPYGLRTLDPRHPDFRPRYAGDLWSRDSAYHQGTVWPFLLPEYFIALLKVNGDTPENRKEVIEQLQKLKEHFYYHECIHGISEIFDGLEPSQGKGCAQQAWSVSNLVLLLLKYGITL